MPRPKTPSGYPVLYAQLIEQVSDSGEEFHHECADKKAAQLLRFNLYDFMKACRRSPLQKDKRLAEQGAGLMFCVRDNTLIVKSRDTVLEVSELEQSLNRYMAQAPAETFEASTPVPHDTVGGKPSQDELIDGFLKGKK